MRPLYDVWLAYDVFASSHITYNSHVMDVGSAYVKVVYVRHATKAMMKLTRWM